MGLWELHIHPDARELHFSFKQLHIESFDDYLTQLNGPGLLNRMDAEGNWLQFPSRDVFDKAGALSAEFTEEVMGEGPEEWNFVVDVSRNFFTEFNVKQFLAALAGRVSHINEHLEALPRVARASVAAANITADAESISSRMRTLCLTSNVLMKLPFFDGLVCPCLKELLVNHNHLTTICQKPVVVCLSVSAPNLEYFDCAHNRIVSLDGIHDLLGSESGLLRLSFTCNLIHDFGSLGLPSLPKLAILGMTSNYLPASERLDTVLGHIASKCPMIQSLYFNGNPCVGDLLAYRATAQRLFPRIQLLDGVDQSAH